MPDDDAGANAPGDSQDDTSTQDDSTATDEPDWKSEAEKWKTQARKHEERAKANATAVKELDTLRKTHMTDAEKIAAEAEERGRKAGRAESAKRLVDLEVKAAAAGRTVNVDALLEGLDRERFLSDDGEPDAKAIAAWVDKVAPKNDVTDLGQGARGSNGGSGDMNALLRQAAGRG